MPPCNEASRYTNRVGGRVADTRPDSFRVQTAEGLLWSRLVVCSGGHSRAAGVQPQAYCQRLADSLEGRQRILARMAAAKAKVLPMAHGSNQQQAGARRCNR